MIAELLHKIEVRLAEIRLSLAAGNASNWESYHRMVGEYQGLERVKEMINDQLKEPDED
jgi:hypothetical protein